MTTLLLLAGCGAAVPNSGAQTGTVAGTVELRACGGPPPLATSAPCSVRPMAGARVDLEAGSQTITSAVTDSTGRYSVSVAPGTYTVHVFTVQIAAMTGNSRTVTVVSGHRVVADFQLIFQAA